jgi:hypothetical protein
MYFWTVIACTFVTLLISVFVFHVWCLSSVLCCFCLLFQFHMFASFTVIMVLDCN